MGPEPMISVLTERRNLERETDTHRGKTMGSNRRRQSTTSPGRPEAAGSWEGSPQEEPALPTPWPRIPASRL